MGALEACPWCGKGVAGTAPVCGSCGGVLLVDVKLSGAVLAPKNRFQLAKQLAELNAPMPAFAELQARLAEPSGTIARKVSRPLGAKAVALVAAAHGTAVLVPSTLGAAPSAARGGFPLGAVAVALAVLAAGVGGVSWLRHSRLSKKPVSSAVSAAPATPTPPPETSPAPAARPMTTREIGERAFKGVASVSCGNSRGAGFFVEPEVVLTNAHVACALDTTQEVAMKDGRTFQGTTVWRDDWLDLARVRVSAAEVSALPLGDSTALGPGDKVVYIGSPGGFDFSLNEGTVSFVGRNLYGVGYLQLGGAVNPGNSGGPVFNEHGQVVGLVTLKARSMEGVGLALPVQYAVPPAPDAGTPASTRWEELMARLAAEDEKDLGKIEPFPDDKVVYVGVISTDTGYPRILTAKRWTDVPRTVTTHFRLEIPPNPPCEFTSTTTRWAALTTAAEEPGFGRRARWMLRHGVGKDIFVGSGKIEFGSCEPTGMWRTAQIVYLDGDPEHDRQTLDLPLAKSVLRPAAFPEDDR